MRSPDRAFDAVVIGEYERAFPGDQFRSVLIELQEHGVELWLPETNGPVDLDDPTHHALMLMLRSHSRREVIRARHRVIAPMQAQGRFLGGRPPYGYRLVDAGEHPNRPTPDGAADNTNWTRNRRVTQLATRPRPSGSGRAFAASHNPSNAF